MSLTDIKLPDILSTMLNNDPDLPINATCPSGNTSNLILADEFTLPLNCIVGPLVVPLLGVIRISDIF